MERKTRVITLLNILLVVAMVLHISIKVYLHGQHPEYSSPAYFELINALYYLIPLLIVNIIGMVLRKR